MKILVFSLKADFLVNLIRVFYSDGRNKTALLRLKNSYSYDMDKTLVNGQ